MEKFFNSAAPSNPTEHYMLSATDEKLYARDVEFSGKTLHIVGL